MAPAQRLPSSGRRRRVWPAACGSAYSSPNGRAANQHERLTLAALSGRTGHLRRLPSTQNAQMSSTVAQAAESDDGVWLNGS